MPHNFQCVNDWHSALKDLLFDEQNYYPQTIRLGLQCANIGTSPENTKKRATRNASSSLPI